MLIDTHAHLNFNAYKNDADEVIRRSLDNNIWMINVGSTYETSKRAVEIAEKYPEGIYAAIGLHPIHLAEGIFKTKLDTEEIAFQTKNEKFDYEKYKELAKSNMVVAIGEIGFFKTARIGERIEFTNNFSLQDGS
jgi:TatD DNase family protein